jgi:hypothetical protein
MHPILIEMLVEDRQKEMRKAQSLPIQVQEKQKQWGSLIELLTRLKYRW